MSLFRSEFWAPVLIIYYLLHVLIRTSLGEPLTAEEAMLVERAGEFRWTYDGTMPLYPWLQYAFFWYFGPTVLAISLLKNLILLLTCVFVNRLVNSVAGRDWAWMATVGLAFIPHMIWKAQHEMTATVLAGSLAVALVLVVQRLQRNPGPLHFALLGITAGLGLLASVDFIWVILGLALAAFSTASFRPLLLRAGIVLSVVIAAIMYITPPWNDMAQFVFAIPSLPFAAYMSDDLALSRVYMIYDVFEASLGFAGVFMIGVCVIVYKGVGIGSSVDEPVAQLRELLGRSIAIGMLVVLLGVALVGVEPHGDETVLPLLILAAPLAALYICPTLNDYAQQKLVKLAALIAAGVLLLSPAYYSYGGATGPVADANAPSPMIDNPSTL